MEEAVMGHYKCAECGFEYHADKPYETCPGCESKCAVADLSTDCRRNPDFCRIPEEKES
jgi:DNA-directed RNA polymerase subunit RPC12/RpoP